MLLHACRRHTAAMKRYLPVIRRQRCSRRCLRCSGFIAEQGSLSNAKTTTRSPAWHACALVPANGVRRTGLTAYKGTAQLCPKSDSIGLVHRLYHRERAQGSRQPGSELDFIHSCRVHVCESILILLPMGQLDALISEPGVQCVRPRRHEMAQALCRHRLHGLRVELGRSELRRAVDGDTHVELAFFGTHLGTSAGEVSDQIGLARFLLGLVALACWQAADGVPLHTTVECGSRRVGYGRWQGLQVIIQRQQRLPATRHDQWLFWLR